MNDAPHKAIILADYNDFGAGYAYCPPAPTAASLRLTLGTAE
jgi:hypothetical protein